MPSLYAGSVARARRGVSETELAVCRRVASYIRRAAGRNLADLFGERDPDVEKKRQGAEPFVELYLVFYDRFTGEYDRALVRGIRGAARGLVDPAALKAAADEFIAAHSVVWVRGVPYWRVLEMEKQR